MAYPTDRRSFVIAVGAGMFLPTFWARAQKAALPVIGYLGAESPTAFASRLGAFRQGLADAGYVEGRNVEIEFRWAEGQHSRLTALAAELVSRRVDVIVAPGGAPAAIAAKAATTSIPIVFEMGGDPLRLGLVGSLSHPGGNLTGVASFNVDLSPKRLQLLREVIPTARVVAVLVNPTSPTTESQVNRLQAAAHELNVQVHIVAAANEQAYEAAFDKVRAVNAAGVVVASDTYFALHSEPLAAVALKHRLPAITQTRDFPIAGGLMSYGGNFFESHRLAGVYTARIIKGARPADLPVQQVKGFEFFVNRKTAKILGITLPMTLLASADKVIE
jgi:putative tryptophan/tyrosine transport system substrate-binding protein